MTLFILSPELTMPSKDSMYYSNEVKKVFHQYCENYSHTMSQSYPMVKPIRWTEQMV